MSLIHKVSFRFLILGVVWQLIMIQRLNSLKISFDKEDIEFRIRDYFEYLQSLDYINKGIKKFWKVPQMKKEATLVCDLKRAQLFTLCQWIANSEAYKQSGFELTRVKQFLQECQRQYIKFSNEKEKRLLEMVTCPYIKKRYLLDLKDNELLSSRPGTLFVTGSVGKNSALVFISRLQNYEIICEPYGHVTEIDMATLKKIRKFNAEALKAIDLSAESAEPIDDRTQIKDSEEFAHLDSAKRPLYFRDLL